MNPIAKIEILLLPGGRVHVNAPLDNPHACSVLIGHALIAIAQHQAPPSLIAAGVPSLANLRGEIPKN